MSMRRWKSLTQQVRRLLDELPASTERDEVIGSLKQLISVLEDLTKALGALPTAEEAARAKESLAKLESIVDSNPLLRRQPAKNSPSLPTRKRTDSAQAGSSFSHGIVAGKIERLGTMSESALRNALENPRDYPNSLLRALLGHLGRKVPSKGVRREMVEQLAVTIINRRTYEGLRGEQHPE